ncbi:MAG: PAS domain S-box protein, partial [Methanomicrobiaceae archaeon]|nr:PAS domain S-box protein [Methanomicrobiaceae archaeon]
SVCDIRNVSRPTITGVGDAGLTNIMTDITKRKKAENSLRKSEEQYRSLFENAAEGIIFADMESMKFIKVNPAICRMLSYTEDELLSMGVSDIHPEKDVDHAISEFKALSTGKITMTKKIPCLCKDKTIRLMDITSSSVTVNGKKYIIGLFTDATERCDAEVALRKSEYKLNAIVRGSPIPQFVIDAGHRITHWNEAIEKYSGIKAAEVIGTDRQWRAFYTEERPCLADLLVNEDAERISEWYPGKYAESKLIEGAYEATDFFPQMGESGVWLYFTATAIRDDENRIIGAVETLIDITYQKKAEESLRDALTEKEVLILEIHHRVKNNLAVIISLISMQAKSIHDEEALAMLQEMQGRIAIMGQVHQFLYDSKNLEHINFGDFIKTISTMQMQSFGRERPIEVQIEGENTHVNLDVAIPAGLIINELLTNAIKHAFPGDHPPPDRVDQPCRIIISFNRRGDEYTLVFSDNGIGIPPDFNLQLTQTLGLRLVNNLAQHQLMGTINMNTTKGTEFVIKFKSTIKWSVNHYDR